MQQYQGTVIVGYLVTFAWLMQHEVQLFWIMGTANMIYVGNLTIFFINDLDCGCTAFSWYFPNKGHSHYCKVIAAGLHLVSNPKFNPLRSFLVEIWKNAKVR